jgi:hypothetical protein
MSKLKVKSALKIIPAVLLALSAGSIACNPRVLPGFKEETKRQEERITKETEEAIKKSPALQQLDHLCTQEISRPEGFISVKKSRDFNEEKFVSYGYHSSLDYQSVKRFYLDYSSQHGWQLTKQKDGGWGPSELEFRKDSFAVIIYDMGGGEGENYAVVCKKL